jgi:selenocysteine lyase/cysteine desulfurase
MTIQAPPHKSTQASPAQGLDLSTLRAETPGCASRIHLNNAGAALMPQPVLAAIGEHIALEAEIGGYEAAEACAEAIDQVYGDLGDLVGCKAHNIALVENATVAYSQALSTIPFERGDVILTSKNDYISNQLMFLALARRFGVEVIRAPDMLTGGVDPEAVGKLLSKRRPKLVAMTWIPTNSGLVQPVEKIGQLCRHHGVPYLVDACQTVGQFPIDVEALGCDFLSATGRKFLRGPRGTGFLYVADHVLEAGAEPLFIDMRGAEWTAPNVYRPTASARRFENWEFAYALILGIGAAARYANKLGVDNIANRTMELTTMARQRLSELNGVRLLDYGPRLGAIIALALPTAEPHSLLERLRQQHINTSLTFRNFATIDFAEKHVEWALRVSPHYYNTYEEIDALVEALQEILST